MCGIAGYYNFEADKQTIDALFEKLHHRGPDRNGIYQDRNVGLIHTRLSIIELSELGAQPYHFDNLVLTFNGEIYNYKEIRSELLSLGYTFQSNSDSEVLIKAFHKWREEAAQRFIGMFAFCIYDKVTKQLFLFRDRIGVKPLYYYYKGESLIFASELRALMEFDIKRDINHESVGLYFRFGFIPKHHSIYNDVFKLEPGHYLVMSGSQIRKVKYWNPTNVVEYGRSEGDLLEELESLLISAFNYRMVSDVPVGVFLSGGIDSSLLAALLQKNHGGISSFTIGFNENSFDESIHAKKVADYLGTAHHAKILLLDEARSILHDFYKIYDEPFADTSGIPTSCVTKLAKDAGMKVVLSADGGDELFGGYSHYGNAYALYKRISRLPLSTRKGIAKSIAISIPTTIRRNFSYLNFEHRAYAMEELLTSSSLVEFFESFIANQTIPEINNLLANHIARHTDYKEQDNHSQQLMLDWDFNNYLPDDLLVKVDRATMYHGIECREPFLDHRIAEFSFRIPIELKIKNGIGKYPLRQLLLRHFPATFFERKKQGFSIPIFSWFKTDLDNLFRHYFSDEKLNTVQIFNKKEVLREYKKYLIYKKGNKQYNIEKMWRILSFMMWWDNVHKS